MSQGLKDRVGQAHQSTRMKTAEALCWTLAADRLLRKPRSGLLLARRDIVRRKGRAFAEKVLLHLLQQKFLSLLRAEIQPVFVHEHLHVLDPHFPGFFRYVLVDALAERMALERHFLEPFHFALEFHAEDLARAFRDRSE